MRQLNQAVPFSTMIDLRVKVAVGDFCKRRGLKLRYLVEQALVEQIEDEMDVEAYFERRNQKTIPLEKIIASGKRKKR